VKCSRCQHENRSGAKFCEECATPLARACSNCGSQLSATAKFCSECAHPVVAGAALRDRFASPDSYTPKHLAEKILTSKSALEGERKQVTVLFADLKGSMELLADRDPEEARKLLDPVLERMMEAVHRYEGTVNQVMGDGIMALFGAPLAHEDHAVRACYAAIQMQESAKRYAERARPEFGVTLRIRVGLNSGEVVVRSIGSDLRMDYSAIGQTTHLAARMEQLADPGSILLAPHTLALAEGFVQVRPLGPTTVKGLPAPIEVYELAGLTAARSRLQAATSRGLSRFVGRDLEFAQLLRARDQAQQGRGQLVAVVGEPGVGKSRLTFELTHSHVDGWLVLHAGSVSYGKATGYLPVIQLLKTYFSIADHDSSQEIREKLTSKIVSLDRTLEGTLPALLALLDAVGDDPQWTAIDPAQRRQRMLDAVRRLLLREAQVRPLLLIFEDLHWVDSETQAFLESLVESLPTAKLLLLINYRPEYQHAWGSKTYYTQLRLDALPHQNANQLLLTLLGADASVEPLKPILITRTGGNPLFLEESVRMLVETNALTGKPGAHQLVRPVDTIDIPATVQAMLASRIDRLAPEDKQLLQTASVVGKDVPLAPLVSIADLNADDVHRGLARLQAAEFLYETNLFPEPEYTFKHALTHEVAYGSLLQAHRRALHVRIGEALEGIYSNRLDEHTERLAHHAFQGEVWEKAATYALRAGRRAGERSAVREGGRYGEQGLDALAHLPPSRAALELALHLRQLVYHMLFVLGEDTRLAPWAEESVVIADRLGDNSWRARSRNTLANALWFVGNNVQAVEICEQAQALAEAIGDVGIRITTALDMGQICRTVGDYRRGAEALARAVDLLQGDLARNLLERAMYPFVTVRGVLSHCLAELGEFPRATILGQQAMSFAESVQQPASLATAASATAFPLLIRGAFGEAIPRLEQAFEISRQSGIATNYPTYAARLGQAYATDGRPGEALGLFQDALARAPGLPLHELSIMLHVSEGYLFAGRQEDALAIARRALDLARARSERGSEARALWLLGELASRLEALEAQQAEERYRQAIPLAVELGMRPLVAHCHLGLGKLYRRTGQREQAQEHLTTATTMYREMGMTYWLEQAEAEIKDVA